MAGEREYKKVLCNQLISMLEKRAEETEEAMQALKESRENETKSSAGDKYETAREMIRIELEKYDVQLRNTRLLLHELSKIDLDKEYDKVETGSLVFTSLGNYFMSVGIGKVDTGKDAVFVISVASPLGQALKDKAAGDSGTFQGKNWMIDRIA